MSTAAARLPGSRWRAQPSGPARGAKDRVRRSHAQTRISVRMALGFLAAAAVAWAAGTGTWLALHLLLAGGVVLAISGVSLMLTVTWSAAPAPGDGVTWLQRACVALGAAGVALGRHLELGTAVLAPAGIAYVSGLVLLAGLLVVTVRRGPERRFDPAVTAYVLALVAGLAGVVAGVTMALDTPSQPLRDAHVALNLLGLVGLVVGGTLPYFAATVGRARMAPWATGGRLRASTATLAGALAIAVVGLVTERSAVLGAGLAVYAAGIVAIVALLPRPTGRQLRWAGPRLLGLWAGALWWTAAVAAWSVTAFTGELGVLDEPWLLVLVVAGYVQILWGSLAYLLPVLRGGGHEQLAAGFATTRSWVGLAAVNVAAVALVAGARWLAAIAVAGWAADAAVRSALVVRTRTRPTPAAAPDAGPETDHGASRRDEPETQEADRR